MAFFSLKVGEKTYELDRLTLGEARTLKREFGLTDLASFSGTDPDQLVGLLYLALKREQPAMSHEAALSEIEGLDIGDMGAPDEVPTPAAPEEPSAAADGVQETSPVKDGRRSTRKPVPA